MQGGGGACTAAPNGDVSRCTATRLTAGRSRIHKKDGKCGALRFPSSARLNLQRNVHILLQVRSAVRRRCISLQARATLQKICRLLVELKAGGDAGR